MIVYRRWGLVFGEAWFDEQPDTSHLDIVRFRQAPNPIDGGDCEPKHTVIMDLLEDEEHLLARVEKSTRYQLRRAAERDNLLYEHWADDDVDSVIAEFVQYYDSFAAEKGISSISSDHLKLMAGAGVLAASRVGVRGEPSLVWHLHFKDQKRARLLNSASLFRNRDSSFRNLVGRANRYAHWEDIRRFRSDGLTTYDFGGWYAGDEDAQLLGINRFKEQFGGQIVKDYNCEKAVSLKGRLGLRSLAIVRKLRSRVGAS